MGKGDTTRQSSNVYVSFGRRGANEHDDNSTIQNSMSAEDSRISKLLRLLSRENDQDKFCSLARQLQQSFKLPENGKYIRRAFDMITKSLLDLLHTGPGLNAKCETAKCLGRLGYILDQNIKRFIDWIFSTFSSERNEDVSLLLLKALLETLKLDKKTHKTEAFASTLISRLVNALEFTHSSDFFIVIVDAILLVAEMYPSFFTKHFRDMVDILVGWHIDSSQGSCITEYTSRSLQRLSHYWIEDEQFSITLITQFFEDMEAYAHGVHVSNYQSDGKKCTLSKEQCVIKITSLIKVLNTVLKCMGQHLHSTSAMKWNFLNNCFSKMLDTVIISLEFLVGEELIIAANECSSLLMTFLQNKVSSNSFKLCSLINLELGVLNVFGEEAVISMLSFTSRIVLNVSANLPVQLVHQILTPESPVLKLRFSTNMKIQNAVLGIYHSLLNLKNISPLQEAYRYILGDLEVAYKKVMPSLSVICQTNPFIDVEYADEDVEMVIMFHLRALADLAKASSSIIGIWALQPSILELLAVKLEPFNKNLVNYSPTLQYCIIYLLYTHCTVNNNFVSSSGLVSAVSDVSNVCDVLGLQLVLSSFGSTSPTSGYFSLILVALTKILTNVSSQQTISLTLDWARDVITQVKSYIRILQHAQEFGDFLHALVSAGHTHDEMIVLKVLQNLEELLSCNKTSWNPQFLLSILSLCFLHNNSYNDAVSSKSCQVMTLLPWYIIISGIEELMEPKRDNLRNITFSQQCIHGIQKHYITKNTCGRMPGIHFKKLIGYVLNGVLSLETNWMLDTFHSSGKCSHIQEDHKTWTLFNHVVSANDMVLLSSLSWQAAQFCTTTKLRTPLGKPQDTFTSIEGAIKNLVKELHTSFSLPEMEGKPDNLSDNTFSSSGAPLRNDGSLGSGDFVSLSNTSFGRNGSTGINSASDLAMEQEQQQGIALQPQKPPDSANSRFSVQSDMGGWEHRRVRLLLEFLENLEKCIYNAAEGSTTLSPPSKTVRLFFHTNKNTCAQWFVRIRMAVIVVALHSGYAAAVVRYAHCFIQDLVDSKNIQGSEFERTVLYLSWALCRLREPRAIVGLFAWCLGHGRKFQWLQAVAEQAASKYESALNSYTQVLGVQVSSTSSKSDEGGLAKPNDGRESNQLLREFISEQVMNCYLSLNNFEEFLKWNQQGDFVDTEQVNATSKQLFGNGFTIEQVHAMKHFQEYGLSAFVELEKWNSLHFEESSINTDKLWNSSVLINYIDATLVNISLQLAIDINRKKIEETGFSEQTTCMKTLIEKCMALTKRYIQEGLGNMPSESLHTCVISNFAGAGLLSVLRGEPEKNMFTASEWKSKLHYINTSVLTNVVWWTEYFDQMNGKRFHNQVNDLYLDISRIARKESNYYLAKKLLLKCLSCSGFITDSIPYKEISLKQVIADFISFNSCITETWNARTAKACMEGAKLLYYSNCHSSAVEVCALTSIAILNMPLDIDLEMSERKSRTLLTLAKWLQMECHLEGELKEHLNQIFSCKIPSCNYVNALNSITPEQFDSLFQCDNCVVSSTDTVIGRLLYTSVCHCPAMAKAWSGFAAWCYRCGRRSVDGSSKGGLQLIDAERIAIQDLLPLGSSSENLDEVFAVLNQTTGADGEDLVLGDSVSNKIETHLRTVNILRESSHELLSQVAEIWRNAHKRSFTYYKISAESYFKYLNLCNYEGPDGTTITACLRLLRLIAKYPFALQDVLENGLCSTPTRPWKGIIPQLFSRLGHPEAYVRKQVSELLCRVAVDASHQITFPAVVGAITGTRLSDIHMPTSTHGLLSVHSLETEKNDIYNYQDEIEEEDDNDDESIERENKIPVLKNCFQTMVDFLTKKFPEIVLHVKLLVQELRRITLLWDELWLGTLVQHQSEITRCLTQLEQEVIRVDKNMTLDSDLKLKLITEKHRIVFKPIVFVLEQLQCITSVPPETPHEKWFQEKFGECVSDALNKLKFPANPRCPNESWQPMKQFQSRLQQRFQKRTAYTIHISNVSPVLSAMKSNIAMPGVPSSEKHSIRIASVDNNVTILPTKTKPKKLVFRGSDGHVYSYLLKGLEDLHLDERVMQFLRVANTMMQHGPDADSYIARHYSVIPLGPCSGLISWVDGVTPLFSLYKRWQQRQVLQVSLKVQASGGDTASNNTAQVMRPSELFFNKLRPLLKEVGIGNTNNRKEWPLPVLRQVLTELMEETPKDLLAKELWYNSVNASHWWQIIRTYSCSVAVMSMIGYIIGLGDRHLDNILVDLNTGEVVHIDYNVCFEKGTTLRIPEKVPFRMTPNICTGLGVTGVEGIFRQTSEHVLKVMRKGRETLLTLLEAFVYDPLIDWKPENDEVFTGAVYGGQALILESKQRRKELEREVAQSMFCIRMTEIKSAWMNNRDDLIISVPQLDNLLRKWLEIHNEIPVLEKTSHEYLMEMELVKEAITEGPGSENRLYTLGSRYVKFKETQDTKRNAREMLKTKLEDVEKRYNIQSTALASVRSTELDEWAAKLSYPEDESNNVVNVHVNEILQNAGQNQMVIQYEQSDIEFKRLTQQQTTLMRTCLDLLRQYGSIAGLYPVSYFESHRTVCFIRWAKYLLENISVERCREVADQFQSLFSPDNNRNNILCHTAVSFSYHLQSALQNANVRLSYAAEKMTSKGLPDSIATFENDYKEAQRALENFCHREQTTKVAIEGVALTTLCSLNRQYLMKEATATSAGEYLMDLTSFDGEWFLDEMHFLYTLLYEFCKLLSHEDNLSPTQADDIARLRLILQCLHSCNIMFRDLKELNFNFHTIILPEALKTLQIEEPSVLSVINTLDEIIQSIGCPITDLIAQLELHLRYVIMDMDSPHSHAQKLVSVLQSKFESLFLYCSERHKETAGEDGLSPGNMLLMGFNCLFEALQIEGTTFAAAFERIDIPTSWKTIDQIREAKALSAFVVGDRVRGVLDSIFFLKRLQIIQDFFALCSQMARMESPVYDNNRISKPIRQFTADYVRRHMFGVSSQILALLLCFHLNQCLGFNIEMEVERRGKDFDSDISLEELIHMGIDNCVKSGIVNTAALKEASLLVSNLENAWQQREYALRIQQEYEFWRSTSHRLQLQLTAHHWLYEDLLPQNVLMSSLLPVNRTTFMREIRKTSTSLLTLQSRLNEVHNHHNVLVVSIEQRLKWVSGANPALSEVMTTFDSEWQKRTSRFSMLQNLATVVSSTCNAILHHEALRTRTSEAIANDASFLQMLEYLERSCALAGNCEQSINAREIALIHLLAPEETVDLNWLHKVEILISDKIKSLQKQRTKLLDDFCIVKKNLKKHVVTIRDYFVIHRELMFDVHKLIKSLAKSEAGIRDDFKNYLITYRTFSEYYSLLIRELINENLDYDKIIQSLKHIEFIKEKTNYIYAEILEFADNIGEKMRCETATEDIFSGGSRVERDCMVSKEDTQVPKVVRSGRDSKTGKAVQTRNSYALGVWHRVRMKLEGRDPDTGRKYSVQEQVDYVTNEAMNLDNLALLYEGWTPWV
ncbi:Serine/threonine-protein kinase Smg1 [Gryllus bimaculatus]|nr:Serine/threonine-protein kinase Smg1 [Gryllus bimaculatus]